MYKGLVTYFLSGALTFFLILNIIASQAISPLFIKVVTGQKDGIVNYLIKIKGTPEFDSEYSKYHNIFGEDLDSRIFANNAANKALVSNFEQILTKNPKSRDALYGLYKIYRDSGDTTQAEQYLKLAREVDPDIK